MTIEKMKIPGYLSLENLTDKFPEEFTENQLAAGQTLLLKKLALRLHKFYKGKVVTIPKAAVFDFGWFGVWYTPGVSAVSTSIRDDNLASYQLSSRGNTVAVVSDSTRVLGDGDVTPSGGLGVMEGKAFLMYYLGGISANALCINSYNDKGVHDPDKIIEFVKMVAPSFGAINLEDISQPNCYKVLDSLQDVGVPVWHDDAQGTACVTLAGLINALKLAGKKISDAKIVLFGAGASNTTVARLCMADGADPKNIILFDSKGAMHKNRDDIAADSRFYRKQELCGMTNPKCIDNIEEAMKGADVFVSLSKSGPGVVPKSWIELMAEKSIVFACANPVPEIYPHEAKEAGAYIVATGRSDFPNQVNNSLGFPGILKGCLLVRAKCVTDKMAITASHSLAESAQKRGIHPEYIVPKMDEDGIYRDEATAVGLEAIAEGVAQEKLSREEIYVNASDDITQARELIDHLIETGLIQTPPEDMIRQAVIDTIAEVKRDVK